MVRLNLKQKTLWLWKHKFISLLLLVVLIVAGFFVYQKVATELDRRAFADARIAIDEVYADIVKEVGEPDNSKSFSECNKGYTGAYSLVTTCSINTDLIYKVDNKMSALNKIDKIKNIVKKYDQFHKSSAPQSSIYPDRAPGSENIEDLRDFYKFKGKLLCIFKYIYDIPEEIYLNPRSNIENKKLLYIASGCSGTAKAIYYTLSSAPSSN